MIIDAPWDMMARFQVFQMAFYFFVKVNNHPDVFAIFVEDGFGLNVSSGMELEMALLLGARDIVFSGYKGSHPKHAPDAGDRRPLAPGSWRPPTKTTWRPCTPSRSRR